MSEGTIEVLVIIEPIDTNHSIDFFFTIHNHTQAPEGVVGSVD
jgi:hypothetical protein